MPKKKLNREKLKPIVLREEFYSFCNEMSSYRLMPIGDYIENLSKGYYCLESEKTLLSVLKTYNLEEIKNEYLLNNWNDYLRFLINSKRKLREIDNPLNKVRFLNYNKSKVYNYLFEKAKDEIINLSFNNKEGIKNEFKEDIFKT